MTRHDWWTAGVTAAGVAALMTALLAQPLCWAKDTVLVKVPALPSTQLAIPAMKAQVSATTKPKPGDVVQVQLAVKSPARADATVVPVTVTVLRTEMGEDERSMPEPTRVTELKTRLPINKNGAGATTVTLPLQWVKARVRKPTASRPSRIVNYQLVLSATVAGKTVCSDPETLAMLAPPPRQAATVRTASARASKPSKGPLLASAKK